MYICTHITYTCVYTYMYMHICTYVHMYIYVMCVCVCVNTYIWGFHGSSDGKYLPAMQQTGV